MASAADSRGVVLAPRPVFGRGDARVRVRAPGDRSGRALDGFQGALPDVERVAWAMADATVAADVGSFCEQARIQALDRVPVRADAAGAPSAPVVVVTPVRGTPVRPAGARICRLATGHRILIGKSRGRFGNVPEDDDGPSGVAARACGPSGVIDEYHLLDSQTTETDLRSPLPGSPGRPRWSPARTTPRWTWTGRAESRPRCPARDCRSFRMVTKSPSCKALPEFGRPSEPIDTASRFMAESRG
jgi:hypothetical protein